LPIDGNKRSALTITAIFLEITGYTFDAPESEAVVVFEKLAAGELSETELRQWLSESSTRTA